MGWALIPLSAVQPIPWRNGGGITRELIAWPDSQNWIWRISVAEVASDGAFSHFEGAQRWLSILAGTGVQLSIGSKEVERLELSERSEPLAFEGSTPVYCNLLQGAVQDLNLMLRYGHTGHMQRVCGRMRSVLKGAKIVAVYSVNTPAVLQLNGAQFVLPKSTLAWQTLSTGSDLIIEANSAILMAVELKS